MCGKLADGLPKLIFAVFKDILASLVQFKTIMFVPWLIMALAGLALGCLLYASYLVLQIDSRFVPVARPSEPDSARQNGSGLTR